MVTDVDEAISSIKAALQFPLPWVALHGFEARVCFQAGGPATVALDGSGEQLDALDAALRLLQAAVAAAQPPHILLVTGGLGKVCGGFPKLGVPFWGPYNENCSILGSILGSLYLGKLPCCKEMSKNRLHKEDLE